MRVVNLFLVAAVFLLMISLASAGIGEWFNGITGRATNPVSLNVTVGVPVIYAVYNTTMTDVSVGLNSGPSATTIMINFSVYNPSGFENLNLSTARINFTRSGEDLRQNLTCANIQGAGNYANYTCLVTMWWWDGAGSWSITAHIKDNQSNSAMNGTTTFSVGSTTGFQMGPSALAWAGIGAGALNQTSSNDPLLLNNTGNKEVGLTTGNITVNATNLRGETNSVFALWAGNFSVGITTGAGNPECGASTMSPSTYINVTGSTLPNGNYSINNGTEGQEQLYVCIKSAGAELTTQSYSTANESSWTVQIL